MLRVLHRAKMHRDEPLEDS